MWANGRVLHTVSCSFSTPSYRGADPASGADRREVILVCNSDVDFLCMYVLMGATGHLATIWVVSNFFLVQIILQRISE